MAGAVCVRLSVAGCCGMKIVLFRDACVLWLSECSVLRAFVLHYASVVQLDELVYCFVCLYVCCVV